MAVLKLLFLQFELFESALPLAAVPGVGKQHPADVPKNRADLRQVNLQKNPRPKMIHGAILVAPASLRLRSGPAGRRRCKGKAPSLPWQVRGCYGFAAINLVGRRREV